MITSLKSLEGRGRERKRQGKRTAAQREAMGGLGFRAAGVFHLRTGVAGKSTESKKGMDPSSSVNGAQQSEEFSGRGSRSRSRSRITKLVLEREGAGNQVA